LTLRLLVAVNAWIERALLRLLALLFGALILTIAWQVVGREVLRVPAIWTQEAALFLFAWCVFLGSAVAVRRSAHYVCEVLPPSMPRGRACLKLLGDAGVAVAASVLLWGGWGFAEIGLFRDLETLGIAEAWQMAAMPVGAALMLLFLIEVVGRDIAALRAAFAA
jgi:TRAP-type C4-dicarboxylate transport system permease small subunit